MYNASQLHDLFEHNPAPVAISQLLSFAEQNGDKVMEEFFLDDLLEAVGAHLFLERCLKLEAA